MNTLRAKNLITFLFSSFFIITLAHGSLSMSAEAYAALQSNDTKKEDIEKLIAQDKDFFERIDDQKNSALHVAMRSGIVPNIKALLEEAHKKNIPVFPLIMATNSSGKSVMDLAEELATTHQRYRETEKRLKIYVVTHHINQLKRQLGELELQKKVLLEELKEIKKK